MRTTTAGLAERRSRRLPADDLRAPAARLGLRELTAGVAALAVAAQLALAPVMLLIAAVLTITGRKSRWRPQWLMLPAMAGAWWLAAVRVTVAMAALDSGAARLIAAELAVASHPGQLLLRAGHPGTAALVGTSWWLPRELPLALLGGTAEATLVLWLGWRHAPPAWRPGVIAVVRRRAATAALAASHTVMDGGCAIGVDRSSGRLAGFSWNEAQCGVLLTGPDEGQLCQLGLAVTCAAMRLRKTVIVIESSASPPNSAQAGQVAQLARRLGVEVTEASASDDDIVGSMGRAVRSRRVLIVSASQPDVARHAVAGLSAVLAGLRDRGLRGDCLAWVTSCDVVEPDLMTSLLELGQVTGTCVLLSTTSMTYAASVAAHVGTRVECGHRQAPGAFMLASARRPDASISGTLVPISLASGSPASAQAR